MSLVTGLGQVGATPADAGVAPVTGMPGFLVAIKTSLVQSLRAAFGPTCPWPQYADLYIDIQYPQVKERFPGVLVDFEPVGNITRGSIDQPYLATYDPSTGLPDVYGLWRAQGYATLSIGALSTLERDSLFDIVVSMIAFSHQQPYSAFRYALEVDNPLLAVNLNADTISFRGMAQGATDWETPEVVYEATLAVECVLEFSAPGLTAALPVLGAVDLDVEVGNGIVGSTVAAQITADAPVTP